MERCKASISRDERIYIMVLNFLGRGSGFSAEHTSAYFTTDSKEMVVIDCPMSTFQKLEKKKDLTSFEKFYILITHTHGDHIGGLGLFVQYAYFTLKKPVVVVAPSEAVKDDIETVLRIEGNELSWCKLVTVDAIREKEWFGDCILTQHSPQLENKCFGYHLIVNDTDVVYTGDTSTLTPFLPFLADESELYVDTSVYYGMIHLKLEDALEDFISLAKSGIKVYLMHLDDVSAAEKIVKSIRNVEVVKLVL